MCVLTWHQNVMKRNQQATQHNITTVVERSKMEEIEKCVKEDLLD
jgi:hypothetical protein